MVSPFSCQFIHRKCQREELFQPSYLRTNRTNHTKIMRCFPHCCPKHRNRSYCGSAISIQFEQAVENEETVLSTDELIVYARFRPLTKLPLRIGERIPISTIQASLQQHDPSKGEWIESTLSHSYATNGLASWIFEVNSSGRWYYPWSGAATIALRAAEHTFEVLVFRRGSSSELELLAEIASPKFRLMSFRRGTTTPTSAAGKEGDAGVSSDVSPHASPNIKTTEKPKKTAKKRVHSDASAVDKVVVPMKKKASAPPPSASLSRAPSPAIAAVETRELPILLQSQEASTTHRVSPLDPLFQWLDELPLASSGSRRLREWEELVLEACAAHQAAQRCGAVKRELVPILLALQVSSPRSSQNKASTLDVIDATVRLFIHIFLTVDGSRSTNLTVDTSQLLTPSMGGTSTARATAHGAWLNEIERRAQLFAENCTKASWPDIMTTAIQLDRQRQAGNTTESFGYRTFVAQWREQFVQQQKQAALSVKKLRLDRSVPFKSYQFFHAAPRVWVIRMEDVAIEMDTSSHHALSLLSVLQFWKQLSCLRLDYTSGSATEPPQLAVATVFNTLLQDLCFTRLTLDGQNRWFNCLPSGSATTGTTLMGFFIGDYVGRATSAGTIHFTTYLWPSFRWELGERYAYAWHWTCDVISLSTSTTTMSVIVERASVDPCKGVSFETMPIAQKLRSVGRWQHVCQVQLQYHAQA